MKTLLFTVIAFVVATASAKENQPECVDFAVKTAVQKNFKTFGAGSHSCGIKPLNIGQFLETYLVCVSDETEPTEYIMVVEPRNNQCKVKFLGSATESTTPNFDTNSISISNITDAIQCSQDSSDGILVCRKPSKGPSQEELNKNDPCYETLFNKLLKDASVNNEWGFEALLVISKSEAKELIDNSGLAQDEVDETELANTKKLIDQDNSLSYIMHWTAPSNSGSTVIVADKLTCKESTSVTISSEE